jgi:5-methyltetrahydrofolate--homocysteine methyltransferase
VPEAIHRAYFAAGADLAETNTFSANRISQADYGAEHLVRDINIESAKLARRVADEFTAKDGAPALWQAPSGRRTRRFRFPRRERPGFREIDWDHLVDVYAEQVEALVEGGADFILIETVFDTLNAKAGIMAVRHVEQKLGREIPIMLSMTLTDLSGRNLSGHTVEAFWWAVRHARPVTIGLNCSFGATQLRPHVKALSEIADTLIMVYPNAGLPNEWAPMTNCPKPRRVWSRNGPMPDRSTCLADAAVRRPRILPPWRARFRPALAAIARIDAGDAPCRS